MHQVSYRSMPHQVVQGEFPFPVQMLPKVGDVLRESLRSILQVCLCAEERHEKGLYDIDSSLWIPVITRAGSTV